MTTSVMLIANEFHTPLYRDFQARYAVRFVAQVTTLTQAAALLRNNNGLPQPEVIMFGHDLPSAEQVIEFIRKAQQTTTLRGLHFVVMLDQNTAFLSDELTGIAHPMIYQQTTPEMIATALDAAPVRVSQTAAISVINVKGGTGKTSLLVNLADNLVKRGLKIVMLDADVVDGNVAQALGLSSEVETLDRLGNEIAGGGDANQLLPRYLTERSENFFVLPAPGRSDFGHDFLNEVTTAAIFNALVAQRFDVILVDMPGNVRATPFIATMTAYAHAWFYLLYPTGRAFGQKGFTGAAQIVQGLDARERSRMVVYDHESASEVWSAPELQRQYGLPLAGRIPYDPVVEQSQRAGKTVAEYIAIHKNGMFDRARRAVNKLNGGQNYLDAIAQLTDWIVRHDLKGGPTA